MSLLDALLVHFGAIWEPKIAVAGRGSPSVTALEVKKHTVSCLVLLHHGCISFGILSEVFRIDFYIILESKIVEKTRGAIGSQNVPSRNDFPPKLKEARL